jgi:hypothetical protein
MIKDLFTFDKADKLMWAGVGVFSLILIVAFTVISSAGTLLIKDLIGLVVVMILPGYTIVKLYFNNWQLSDNLTKNPDVNHAIDRLIMSIGLSVSTIIPMNFVWNYLLTMGGGEGNPADCTGADCKTQGSNLWGNVDEEMIYTGASHASLRALLTVILVVGLAVVYKIYQVKKSGTAPS